MAELLLEPWVRRVPRVDAPVATPLPPAPDITEVIEARTDSLTIERLARKKGLTMTATPKLANLQDAFTSFRDRVEAAAHALHQRMEDVATATETAITKFGSAVDKVEAQAKEIDNAANQLSNGGPPLGNS